MSAFQQQAGTVPGGPPPPVEKTAEERKQLLAARVQQEMRRGTGHVESQTDFQATLVRGHRPNHLLHLILSFVTLGFWLIVWILVAVFGGEKRSLVSVDGFGNVATRRV